jgi:hypothetical protein
MTATWMTLAALVALLMATQLDDPKGTASMKKLTPVLFVNSIEDCLPFWSEKLGFEQTMQVEEEGRLGYVGLKRDEVEVMLQTWPSLERDLPSAVPPNKQSVNFLYVEVNELAPYRKIFTGDKALVLERTAEYGMHELVLREPGGHFVTLAQPAGEGTGAE